MYALQQMSSLLAYGQGFLSGDIGSGAGLTEPWARSFGWGGDGDLPLMEGQEAGTDGFQSSGGGGLAQFFSVIQAGAPKEATDSPKVLSRSSTKKELRWDSPPQSPSTVFVHLPHSFLSILYTGTKANATVVGVFQYGSEDTLETLLYLPKVPGFDNDLLIFKPDLLACINGKMVSTENLNLPDEFTTLLGGRPEAFLAHRFSLQKYTGLVFGLWRDASLVPATAEAVFSDAVQALPMLLSNRINAKQYEHLGRRFDAILKVMPAAVVFVDDECAQVIINSAAATLLALPFHGEVDPSLVAAAMRKLTDRSSSRTDPQHWMRLLPSNEELEVEEDWELKMPRRVLHVRSYPVTSHAAHGRLWIYEDVTAERDAEQAIEAANRAKSQFLAMMSHELRTPMTGVLGMLDLLHLTNLGLEQQGLVKIMQESAEGLMEVINNILDYCKIEAGRLQLEEIDFPLTDMFEQIHTMLKKDFLKKELTLKISGEPHSRNVVRGDPVRLRQVLLNLVSNAIKFTECGTVDVSWRFLNPQWVDTTVVATSQSSSAKSKLINQIINASRGEKCSIEHSTSPSGRPIVTLNCSSAGAAGPYLESSVSSSRSLGSAMAFPLLKNGQLILSSINNDTSELRTLGTGRRSFPVSYSHRTPKTPAPEASHNVDTRYSFNERKSIVVVKDPFMGPGSSDTLLQPSRTVSQKDQVPFSQKPLMKDPTSGSEERAFRASKYQNLSVEEPGSLQGSSSQHLHLKLSDQLHSENPKLHGTLDAHSPSMHQSSHTVEPFRANGSMAVKIVETTVGKERMSSLETHHHCATMPWNEAEDKIDTASQMNASEALISGAPSGVQFCKLCGGVLCVYAENCVEEEINKEIKPEDKVWLEVTISDTGVGIGKEQLNNLFVGSQAGSQRRNATGTGLGLAICKGLLCLMEGKMQIDSQVGEGTTVILTVPLLPPEEGIQVLDEPASSVELMSVGIPEPASSEPSVTKTETSAAESTQIRVLVAEDNKVNQLLIRRMFQHFGHEVEVVGNGKLAVEAVQKKVFDLVLMDVQMPILDGLSATRAIRALPPPMSDVLIYALSADNPGSGPMEETGLDGYLRKPIVWEKMSGLVDEILASKN